LIDGLIDGLMDGLIDYSKLAKRSKKRVPLIYFDVCEEKEIEFDTRLH